MSETVGQELVGKTHTAAMCEGPEFRAREQVAVPVEVELLARVINALVDEENARRKVGIVSPCGKALIVELDDWVADKRKGDAADDQPPVKLDQKHTPEPWTYRNGAVYGGEGKIPERFRRDLRILLADREEPLTSPCERDRNLERAAACVNACAGISTAALEGGLIGRLIDTLATSPVVCAGLVQAMEAAELSKRPYADRGNIIQGENDFREQT